ncbi:hypothetical protein, partial [Enterobacter sp.]|uniref:hypothetical protein n=1 Tax=Enterobacter sp. TaxID=42895 RepID=UPI00296FC655
VLTGPEPAAATAPGKCEGATMKFITNQNGKAVFQHNGKILTAAYAMKSSSVAVTPSRLAAECAALRNTAR